MQQAVPSRLFRVLRVHSTNGLLASKCCSFSTASAALDLIGKTLLQLCSAVEEVATFLKTHGDKEEVGCVFFVSYCCLCFCPIGWMAITDDFLWNTKPKPLWRCPDPAVSRGCRSCQNLHVLQSLREFSPSCCPTGTLQHTPANQLHFISGRPPSARKPLFSPLLPAEPLKSCCKC